MSKVVMFDFAFFNTQKDKGSVRLNLPVMMAPWDGGRSFDRLSLSSCTVGAQQLTTSVSPIFLALST
ncbi:hypothetical protein MGG_17673 [Pyricularia oryzae 70-15]|uniref:Uncharacterized protein n=3 Tax=Pyricularia oryzae TaxID=318829 RepID=G4NF49_PYRO7|nr:uncharacterized protein MGG_17673 [Pyricularia oryzae 70-15]EHA47252.1 hypothetical protein MGG_17673 [Pyricularia oryzae 70-15]ELQ38418.1 hypothetical protein OOU_Y34scaffold00540g23 [Pyricularia oryzae Y34]